MLQIITAESYRREHLKKKEEMTELVTKHYEKIWEIAKEFQCTGEVFRINTLYGKFTFTPDFPFSYGNNSGRSSTHNDK